MLTEHNRLATNFSHALDDAEFEKFRTLVEREVGIFLGPSKKDLLIARLAPRLRALALPSFAAYWDYVVSSRTHEERAALIDCVCTNETHFFREPSHFAFLDQHVFPEFVAQAARGRRPRQIRAWSAGCSTGEEPYSLAMALLRRFPPGSGWSLSVMASDVSTRALAHAMSASYGVERAAEIPDALARVFTRTDRRRAGATAVTLSPLVRELVEFVPLNLQQRSYGAIGRFDLIFCRNVLIYFRPDNRRLVVERLLAHLGPDGYLFLGHAESLLGMYDRVRCAGPTIYTHAHTP